jgi:hypothetical protein
VPHIPGRPHLGDPLTPRVIRSSGKADIGLMRHPDADDRMIPVARFADADTGRRYIVELTAADVKNLCADAAALLSADAARVSRWWSELADGSDGRPRAACVTAGL